MEKPKLEEVNLKEWGCWDSPADFLFSSEDQISISRSKYTDREQVRGESTEHCMSVIINPELIEDAPFSVHNQSFSPTFTTPIGPCPKTAYKRPRQNQLRKPHCVDPSLDEWRIQSMLPSEILPDATTSNEAITEEADSSYSQSPEARVRQMLKQNKKQKSQTEEKAKRKVLCSTKNQKSSHNAIEKRYRNNLNSKMAALQKVIPSLQEATSQGQVGDESKDTKEESTYTYRKAAILTQAIEYIAYLEESTEQLGRETSALRGQVVDFKKQLAKLDTILVGSVESSQISTGETLKSVQKSAWRGMILR